MCGIAGIVLKQKQGFNLGAKIVAMTDAIKHRGPDGEGFMTATETHALPHYHTLRQNYTRSDLAYIPASPVTTAPAPSFLAFGHRRLSIIDLSEGGHQPMCDAASKTWITFNGEIYNYIELKEELKNAGHRFVSESDTEVILAAYKAWGINCVKKFNGMWAFCIYDPEKQLCFASRDRFGVKPFYYINNNQLFAFASEQKAFTVSGLAAPDIHPNALYDYLINGQAETGAANFFKDITELLPGTSLLYDLRTKHITITGYYHLQDHLTLENDGLDEKTLIEKISSVFENSVRLRLRSDVEVGTCLSGGIDSSALAVTISEITGRPVYCFTSVFRNQAFNEEHFADTVAKKINARHFKMEPSLPGFLEEVDDLIYSQDVPIWDTSTYAQYKVMQLAKQQGIKVVLDGQGADEIFAGYHHHFAAKWSNLISQANYMAALKDMKHANKTIPNAFLFYTKERLKQAYHFNKGQFSLFFKNDFIKSGDMQNPLQHFKDVNQTLINDIYKTRLRSFLKCEDRCGMWHSVESRTPFSDDVELINLLFSFNGNKKIKNGVSKYLLREAVKDKLPKEIYTRYDKKGFETPMQQWMQTLRPQLLSEIKAADFEFVDYKKLEKTDPNNVFQNKLLFKLFVLNRWHKVFAK
jgi:asparagine synthase (glutamine-hydrolysing)